MDVSTQPRPREPDAAKAAMDRIKLLLSDRPPAGLD